MKDARNKRDLASIIAKIEEEENHWHKEPGNSTENDTNWPMIMIRHFIITHCVIFYQFTLKNTKEEQSELLSQLMHPQTRRTINL